MENILYRYRLDKTPVRIIETTFHNSMPQQQSHHGFVDDENENYTVLKLHDGSYKLIEIKDIISVIVHTQDVLAYGEPDA